MSNKQLINQNFTTGILDFNFLKWLAIVILSALPYIHDVMTISGKGIKGWVPDFGIQKLLMDSEGYILGFTSYRVFVYTFFLHLFAHIGWVGWFFDAKGKSYRTALLVPVALSAYQILVILLNSRRTPFNEPDTKFFITSFLSIVLAINFFYNNKKRVPTSFSKTNNITK